MNTIGIVIIIWTSILVSFSGVLTLNLVSNVKPTIEVQVLGVLGYIYISGIIIIYIDSVINKGC